VTNSDSLFPVSSGNTRRGELITTICRSVRCERRIWSDRQTGNPGAIQVDNVAAAADAAAAAAAA